jgi:hypothetical protein
MSALRLSSFVIQVVIFILTSTEKNYVHVAAANAEQLLRRIKTEDVEEVPLPMINDTDVFVPVNMTNSTDEFLGLPGIELLPDTEDNSTSTEWEDEPLPNATLPQPVNDTTSFPSISPAVNDNSDADDEESPAVTSSTNAPNEYAGTTTPTIASTSAIDDISLTIQSINIVILTDDHSWVQGHGRHEPSLNADYGHILSFYQRLKEHVETLDTKPDLYLVNNGDFLHGTMLGDDPPEHLVGILERMPFDVATVGEHELINDKSVDMLLTPGGLFDEWGERLITSNVRREIGDDNQSKVEPLGNNYLLLEGKQGSVLVLGFLYNLDKEQSVASGLSVADVKDVMQEGWFTSLFASCKHQPQFDAIVVLAHMDVKDELVTLLLSELRKLCGDDMVVQFITGHTHMRSFVQLDAHSSSIEAGRFLDTVGFVSFEPISGSFEHNFIPANEASLARSLGMSVDDYPTHDGINLSDYIARTLDHSGANEIMGCAPKRFNEAELLDMYLNQVMPISFFDHYHSGSRNVLVQYMESFVGYDLFPGVITMNDIFTVAPEDYDIVTLGSIHGNDILQIMKEMNKEERRFLDDSFDIVGLSTDSGQNSSTELDETMRYDLHTLSKDASVIISIMNDLGVKPSARVSKGKTVRRLWIDYIKNQMPYDGDDCKCLQNDGCGDIGQSSGGGSGNTSPSSQYSNPKPQSTPSSPHGTASAPAPSGSSVGTQSGSMGSSHRQPSTGMAKSSNSPSTSNWSPAAVWVLVIIAGAVILLSVKFARRGARVPQFGNDLELQISPGGYSAPTSHLGRYV